MSDLAKKYPKVKVLDLFGLPRYCHSKQGLHLNGKGKTYLCKTIHMLLNKQNKCFDITNSVNTDDHSPRPELKDSVCVNTSLLLPTV